MGTRPKKKQKRSAQKGRQKEQSLDSRDDPRDTKMRNKELVVHVKQPEMLQNGLNKGKPKLGQGKQELPQSHGSQCKTIDSHQHQEPVCKKTNKHNADNSSNVQNQPGSVCLIPPGVGVSQVNPNKQVKSVTKENQGTRSDVQTKIVHGLKSTTAQCNTSVVPSQKSNTETCQTNVVHNPNVVSTSQNQTSMAANPKRSPVVQCKSSAITSPNINLTQCKSSKASGTNEKGSTAKCQTSVVPVANNGNTAKCQTSVVPGAKKGSTAIPVVPVAKGNTAKCHTNVVPSAKEGNATSVVPGAKEVSNSKCQTSVVPNLKKGNTTVPVVPVAKGTAAQCQTSVVPGGKKDNTAQCQTRIVPGKKKANMVQCQPVVIPSPKKNAALSQTSPVPGAIKDSTPGVKKNARYQSSENSYSKISDITGSPNSPETRLDGYQGNEPEGEGNFDKVKLPKKKRNHPAKRNQNFSQGDKEPQKLGICESRLDEDKESENARNIDVKSVGTKPSGIPMQNKSKKMENHPPKNTNTTQSLNSPEANADGVRDNEPGNTDKLDEVKCPKKKRKRKRPAKRNQKLGHGDQRQGYIGSHETRVEQREEFHKKDIVDGRSVKEGNQTVVAASPNSTTAHCQTSVPPVTKKGSTIQCQTTTVPGLKDSVQCQTSDVTTYSDSDEDSYSDSDENSDVDSDADLDQSGKSSIMSWPEVKLIPHTNLDGFSDTDHYIEPISHSEILRRVRIVNTDSDTDSDASSVHDMTSTNAGNQPFSSRHKSYPHPSSVAWCSGEVYDMFSDWSELFAYRAMLQLDLEKEQRRKPISTRNNSDPRATSVSQVTSPRATSKHDDYSGENWKKNRSRPDSGQQYALPRPISTRSEDTRRGLTTREANCVEDLERRAQKLLVESNALFARTKDRLQTAPKEHKTHTVREQTGQIRSSSTEFRSRWENKEQPVSRYCQPAGARNSENPTYQSGTTVYGLASRREERDTLPRYHTSNHVAPAQNQIASRTHLYPALDEEGTHGVPEWSGRPARRVRRINQLENTCDAFVESPDSKYLRRPAIRVKRVKPFEFKIKPIVITDDMLEPWDKDLECRGTLSQLCDFFGFFCLSCVWFFVVFCCVWIFYSK